MGVATLRALQHWRMETERPRGPAQLFGRLTVPIFHGRPPGAFSRMQQRRNVASLVRPPVALEPEARRRRNTEIRDRIAANRTKRLAIAEAMKREAGVREHHVWKPEQGGLAYVYSGRIHSPEGRNMRQLYTVAHECGHIFLHGGPQAIGMPSHVMEMEAESYAHQAFRAHGMELPKELTEWGRRYVAKWISKDRKQGLAIDPRAIAYAQGRRCPYEPLRRVPETWLHAWPPSPPRPPPPWWRRIAARIGGRLGKAHDGLRDWIWPPPNPWLLPDQQPERRETLQSVFGFAWRASIVWTTLTLLTLATDWPAELAPHLFSPGSGSEVHNVTYLEGMAVGLIIASVLFLLRTMVRPGPPRAPPEWP